jgi:hypothetical protein
LLQQQLLERQLQGIAAVAVATSGVTALQQSGLLLHEVTSSKAVYVLHALDAAAAAAA